MVDALKVYLRNTCVLLGAVLPCGVLLGGLLLPAEYGAGISGSEAIIAFTYFWLMSSPLLAFGSAVQHLSMWLSSRLRPTVRGRAVAAWTSPLALSWWLLPANWSLEPSVSENPALVIPFAFVVVAYALVVRPLPIDVARLGRGQSRTVEGDYTAATTRRRSRGR